MYDEEVQAQILKLKFEHGRSANSLADEFGVSRHTIAKWIKKYRADAQGNAEKAEQLAIMEENCKLKQQLAELEKENDFLKKAAVFFAKDHQLSGINLLINMQSVWASTGYLGAQMFILTAITITRSIARAPRKKAKLQFLKRLKSSIMKLKGNQVTG